MMETNNVSFAAFESMSTRLHHIIKTLIVILVISILVNLVSNGLWTYMWLQYDYSGVEEITTTETVTVDGSNGTANYANNGGSVVNGTSGGAHSDTRGEDQNSFKNQTQVQTQK